MMSRSGSRRRSGQRLISPLQRVRELRVLIEGEQTEEADRLT